MQIIVHQAWTICACLRDLQGCYFSQDCSWCCHTCRNGLHGGMTASAICQYAWLGHSSCLAFLVHSLLPLVFSWRQACKFLAFPVQMSNLKGHQLLCQTCPVSHVWSQDCQVHHVHRGRGASKLQRWRWVATTESVHRITGLRSSRNPRSFPKARALLRIAKIWAHTESSWHDCMKLWMDSAQGYGRHILEFNNSMHVIWEQDSIHWCKY